jgi:hypothetical protein
MVMDFSKRDVRFLCFGILVALLTLALPSCVHHHHRSVAPRAKKAGPPPWAPAHGYRHKHAEGVDLVFDARSGVYVVVGFEHHYFYRDGFYRGSGSSWQLSARIGGPWVRIDVSDLPHGLAKRAAKTHGKHGGQPPAKRKKSRGPKW